MAAPLSPISPLPAVGQQVALAGGAGNAVEVPIQPFSNTKEIVILNLDAGAANIVYAQFVDITGGAPAALAVATAIQIPANSAITLAVGAEGNRHQMGTAAWWAANPGSNIVLYLDCAAGTPNVNVTYVNNRGYPDGW